MSTGLRFIFHPRIRCPLRSSRRSQSPNPRERRIGSSRAITCRGPRQVSRSHIPTPCLVSPLDTKERGDRTMKRTFAIVLGGLAAAALFAGLVHAVLVAAKVSQPADTTVQGVTPRRLWASASAMVALVGVVIGGVALARPGSRVGTASGRLGATAALSAGGIAIINGGLNLAVANAGPGSGNGVVGGAAAFVLGLGALALGGLALTRSRRIALPRHMM